jgi:hypothetical protein
VAQGVGPKFKYQRHNKKKKKKKKIPKMVGGVTQDISPEFKPHHIHKKILLSLVNMKWIFFQTWSQDYIKFLAGAVAHICNPSYLAGRDQEDHRAQPWEKT